MSQQERLSRSRTMPSYEASAEGFLVDLRDSVGSDEEADALVTSFTSFFAEMRAGKRSSHTTRALVANFLTDESPTMLEKFVELWDTCRTTNAWAGLSLPVMDEDGLLAAPESMLRSASSVRRGDTMVVLAEATPSARQGSVRPRPRDERAERARDWQLWGRKLVPEGRGSYAIWFTIANLAVIIGIFAYMVGDYGMWIRQNEALFLDIGFSTETYADVVDYTGRVPKYLFEWLNWSATWQSFSFEYLKTWGGRFSPSLESGDWWLWFTSFYLHQNLQHIVSNMLLFVAMSVHLELNYGWWRLLLVWVISGVGANFVSATFEDVCTLLVGASGAVFGFMGLFVADLVVNFESISWPIVRVFTILLFIVFFVTNAVIERNGNSGNAKNVSHASHIGGLICGLFPSMLFLPNLRDKRLKALQRQLQEEAAQDPSARPRPQISDEAIRNVRASFWTRRFPINPLMIVGVLVIIVVFIALPVYLYTNKFKGDLSACPGVTTMATSNTTSTPAARVLIEDGEMRQFRTVKWG